MKHIINKLVKYSLYSSFGKDYPFDIEKAISSFPELKKDKASFVTLYLNGQLRGCIGSLEAYQPLYKDIQSNAYSAAFKDTRFPPLSLEELKNISIEVSVLTKPKKVTYSDINDLKSKITPFIDGVILKDGKYSSTYLPSVWNELSSFEDFFSSLCVKAGIKKSCLKNHPKIYTYQVKKYSESIRPSTHSGSFYPSSCKDINKYFTGLNLSNIKPRALIVPHAGYIYSGEVANVAFKYIENKKYKRIIVIGPSHHYSFKGLSGSFFEKYQTPCGKIKIDLKYLNLLKDKFNIQFKKEVHENEHSTEVQMPFIKKYSNTKVIEIIYGSPNELSELVSYLLKDLDNLLVISTDLSHFLTLQAANKIDMNCLTAVRTLDLSLLYECDACGIFGVSSLLSSVKYMKLKTKILKYKTSFEVSGDETSVVGYMSAIIY